MWSLSSSASAGCHLCVSPRWCFFLQGVEGTASKFIPLAKRGGRLTAINALRRWKFDVVHIYKYHFCAWPLSTDTCQVLHAIWVRDKVQMLVLNEKVTTPKPPSLVWGTRSTGMRTHPPPRENHCKRYTDVTARTSCAYQNGWCFVLMKESDLLAIPSLKEPRKGHSCGRPRTGHPCNFSTTLNFPLNPTVGDGLKCKEPWCVH